jgi:hypothetical protein
MNWDTRQLKLNVLIFKHAEGKSHARGNERQLSFFSRPYGQSDKTSQARDIPKQILCKHPMQKMLAKSAAHEGINPFLEYIEIWL